MALCDRLGPDNLMVKQCMSDLLRVPEKSMHVQPVCVQAAPSIQLQCLTKAMGMLWQGAKGKAVYQGSPKQCQQDIGSNGMQLRHTVKQLSNCCSLEVPCCPRKPATHALAVVSVQQLSSADDAVTGSQFNCC